MSEYRRIDQYEFIEDVEDSIDLDEQYVIVYKDNGQVYRMKASALNNPKGTRVEYLKNSLIVTTARNGEDVLSVGGLFSRPMSAGLFSFFMEDGANPNLRLTFYTNENRTDESKHYLALNNSSKAQWSGHFVWLPIIDDQVYIKVETTDAARVEISLCAAM